MDTVSDRGIWAKVVEIRCNLRPRFSLVVVKAPLGKVPRRVFQTIKTIIEMFMKKTHSLSSGFSYSENTGRPLGCRRLPLVMLSLMALAGAPKTSQAQPGFGVTAFPAIGVTWPTEEGGLYQVQTSSDLSNWISTTAVLNGTGAINEMYFPNTSPKAFYRVVQLPGVATNYIPGLVEILPDSTAISATGSSLSMSNIRVRSRDIGIDDVVYATFAFDGQNQAYRLQNYNVARGVGVFRDAYFARDNQAPIMIRVDEAGFVGQENIQYTVTTTANDLFVADLTVGHALVLEFDSATDDFDVVVETPGHDTSSVIIPSGLPSNRSAIPATVAGTYKMSFKPRSKTSVSFGLKFHNANRNQLLSLTAGTTTINKAALQTTREYLKFKVDLKPDQLLSLTKPANRYTRFTLLNSKSQEMAEFIGLPLNFQPPVADTYYLFLDTATGEPGSYSGSASIKQL